MFGALRKEFCFKVSWQALWAGGGVEQDPLGRLTMAGAGSLFLPVKIPGDKRGSGSKGLGSCPALAKHLDRKALRSVARVGRIGKEKRRKGCSLVSDPME